MRKKTGKSFAYAVRKTLKCVDETRKTFSGKLRPSFWLCRKTYASVIHSRQILYNIESWLKRVQLCGTKVASIEMIFNKNLLRGIHHSS